PGLRLVADGHHGVVMPPRGHTRQQLRHVAGTEHLVDCRKPRRSLLRREVRREHAPRQALAPQELAGPARRPRGALPRRPRSYSNRPLPGVDSRCTPVGLLTTLFLAAAIRIHGGASVEAGVKEELGATLSS
ncbi:hypothetical protein GW17_00047253, partial [Ensete ventricosum]